MSNIALATRIYGEGRICIINDRISGYGTYHGVNSISFWRTLLEWTGQKLSKEILTIALLDNSEYKPLSILSEIYQTKIYNVSLQDISIKDLSKYDVLYVSGLPVNVSLESHQKIQQYVSNGGGIVIESPNRGDEDINILSSMDSVYCLSNDKPIQDNAYWTLKGKEHYIYDSDVKIGFFSTIERSSFNSNWDILMSDVSFSDVIPSFTQSSIETDSKGGSEFGISFVSAMDKGLCFINDSGLNVADVDFNYVGDKVFSAVQYDRIYGIFVSDPIIAEEKFIKWNQLSWESTEDLYSKIFIFVKYGNSIESLNVSRWSGLLINSPFDISDLNGRYIQFMIIMRCDNGDFSIPQVNSINISYFSSENSVRFFTKAFHLGYKPKHVVLTYNAEETDDSIIRFAISGDDSAIISKYQYIEPNKIQYLNGISRTSENIKVMVEMVGTSETQVQVHEFALMFSGDEGTRVNKEAMVSSSSSSSGAYSTSSSSSYGYSTSSSSSSSSEGNSTSSSDSSSSSNGYSTSSSSSSNGYSSSSSSSSSSSNGYSSSSTSTSSISSSSSSSSSEEYSSSSSDSSSSSEKYSTSSTSAGYSSSSSTDGDLPGIGSMIIGDTFVIG
jgi:hypothetical protein